MFSEMSVGGRFKVRVWSGGSGTPLLYLHGFDGNPGGAPFLAELARKWRVIAPDHPGWAGSTEGSDELDDVLDYALYYRAFIEEHARGPVDLLGHDFGGMLAAEVAALSPQLVRKLVLADAYGLWLEEAEIPDVFIQSPKKLGALLWADPECEAAKQAVAALEGADPDVLALNSQQNQSVAAKFLWPVPERGLQKRLQYVKAPTLIIWGEKDALIPPTYARALQAALPGAKVELIEGAGHLPMLEQPDAFVAAVEGFLGGG
jgi:pimeloyl-ACP methyl ester carboxylesterase